MGLLQPLFVYPNYINCDYFKYRGSKKSEIAAITQAAEIAAEIGYEPMQQHADDWLKPLEQEQT
jgi:hypothetical protein